MDALVIKFFQKNEPIHLGMYALVSQAHYSGLGVDALVDTIIDGLVMDTMKK